MECTDCKAINPDNKNYCGECGAALKLTAPIEAPDLRARIQAVLRQELKDQKLVEAEVAEAVVARLTNWAKLFGFVAGIPLALLLLVLGALGVKKYTDLWSLVDAAQNKIKPVVESARVQTEQLKPVLESAKSQTEQLKQRSDDVQKRLADLEPQLDNIKTTSDRLTGYEKQVDEKFASLQKGLDQRLSNIQNDVGEVKKAVTAPGKERWPVKTGQDVSRNLVAPTPVTTTVEGLNALPRPAELSQQTGTDQDKRICPVECTVYTVEATITSVKLELDGDYHMVLQGASGQTMVAEIPTPTNVFIGDSPWITKIAAARSEVYHRIDSGSLMGRNISARARLSGVGFFDFFHGQAGMAPNGLELHPVLGIEFLQQ